MANVINLPSHAPLICTVCGLPLRCYTTEDWFDQFNLRHVLTARYICTAGHKHQKQEYQPKE